MAEGRGRVGLARVTWVRVRAELVTAMLLAGRSLGYTRTYTRAIVLRTVRTRRKLLLGIGQSRYPASP